MDIEDVMRMVEDKLESVAEHNKGAILYFLGEALGTDDPNGIAMRLEQVKGYADALNDNSLMSDAEHNILTKAIDGIQGGMFI